MFRSDPRGKDWLSYDQKGPQCHDSFEDWSRRGLSVVGVGFRMPRFTEVIIIGAPHNWDGVFA